MKNIKNNSIVIYGLVDPRNNAVRYIGQTKNSLKKRLSDHLSDARRGQQNYRCKWLRKIISLNIIPEIFIIEEVTLETVSERERYWISYYGRENLINGTDGGEGVRGLIVTEETRIKLRESHKGQKAWNKGTKGFCEHLKPFWFQKGQIPYNKNIPVSKNTRLKISLTKNKSSKYLGATFHKKSSKWLSQITYKGKSIYCGLYLTEENAAFAYDVFSVVILNDLRNLNFPENEYFYLDNFKNVSLENIKGIRYMIKKFVSKRYKEE